MKAFNVHDAKTHLSKLLEQVERGEEFVIARNGRPIARLSPMSSTARVPGSLKGKIWISEDFDAPLPPELLAAFSGESE